MITQQQIVEILKEHHSQQLEDLWLIERLVSLISQDRERLIVRIEKMKCPIKKNHPEECHFGIALDQVLELIRKQ